MHGTALGSRVRNAQYCNILCFIGHIALLIAAILHNHEILTKKVVRCFLERRGMITEIHSELL